MKYIIPNKHISTYSRIHYMIKGVSLSKLFSQFVAENHHITISNSHLRLYLIGKFGDDINIREMNTWMRYAITNTRKRGDD